MFERFSVIDADTHVTEPRDTWTARVSSRVGRRHPAHRAHRRFRRLGDRRQAVVQAGQHGDGGLRRRAARRAGHVRGHAPGGVRREGPHRVHGPAAHLRAGALPEHRRLRRRDPGSATATRRSRSSASRPTTTSRWTSPRIAPERLLPIVSLPFWDVDASVAEIERCVANGHRGINFCNQPEAFDQPPLWDRHWDPIWSVARDTGVTGQLPHRRRAHRRAAVQGLGDGLAGELLAGVVAALRRQPALHRRPDPRRGLPPLPRRQVRLGGKRRLDAARSARILRLAMAKRGSRRGASRVRPAALGVLPAPDLRLLLVRARDHRHPAARVPGQHAFRDRLPASDLPASRARAPRPSGPETYATEALGSLPDEVLQKVLVDNAAALYGVTRSLRERHSSAAVDLSEALAALDRRRGR